MHFVPRTPADPPQILFVTATDTGAGKTIASCLLVHYFRLRGLKTMAIKPFCSGSTQDLDDLIAANGLHQYHQDINLHFYPQPLSPYAACLTSGTPFPNISSTTHFILSAAQSTDLLIVEGAGGLLTPISPSFLLAHIIPPTHASVLLVIPNKIGCLNHALLSYNHLITLTSPNSIRLCLSHLPDSDPSAHSNPILLNSLLPISPILHIPNLTPSHPHSPHIEKNFKKTLAEYSAFDKVFFPRNSGGHG